MLKKNILLSVLTLIVVFCLYQSIGSKLIVNAIVKLIEINDSLGKQYIDRLNFTLADTKILPGISEKYTLKASDGSKWLFKKHIEEDEEKVFLVYRLAGILGIDIPESYRFSVYVNNRERSGYIMEFIPDAHTYKLSELLSSCAGQKKEALATIALNDSIFGWLTYYRDPQVLVSLTRACFSDFDDSFYIEGARENVPDVLQQADVKPDPRSAYALLKHISGIENKLLEVFLRQSLKGQAQDKNDMVKRVLQRKEAVVLSFFNSYAGYPDLRKQDFDRTGVFLFRLNVCNRLMWKIMNKITKLAFSKKHYKKNEISLVSSGDALLYLRERFIWLRKDAYFKDRDVQALFQDCENKLSSLRSKSDDPREKLAITVYLRQLRTFKNFQEKNQKMIYPAWNIFVPVLLETESIKDSRNIDSWLAFSRYPSGSLVTIDKAPGEEEYMLGLVALIETGNSVASISFDKATKNGYH